MDQSTSSDLDSAIGVTSIGDGMVTNSLGLFGVVGLRTTDLALDNMACCGDCSNAVPGQGPFLCNAGYLTTLYSIKAVHCPDFSSLEAIPEAPQEDERTGLQRRAELERERQLAAERRSGDERRQDDEGWTKASDE